jgi:DNA-binding NarL/FixJ family response regulator
MGGFGMRSTRVLYVENDSALRQFLTDSLANHPEIEIIASLATADEALDRALARKADVALIDFALESNGLNGIELGIALRKINEYIGIVIYSQFNVKKMVSRVPISMRHGWSFFEKSGEMTKDQYVRVIKDTATSKGNWENFFYSEPEYTDTEINKYFALTPRQRSIITLLAQGVAVQEIAHRLNMTYPYVRKELSRAYSVLLPDATEGEDLKTLAILKYLELMEH